MLIKVKVKELEGKLLKMMIGYMKKKEIIHIILSLILQIKMLGIIPIKKKKQIFQILRMNHMSRAITMKKKKKKKK